jgi:predicted XRE-type DNA-binding protein
MAKAKSRTPNFEEAVSIFMMLKNGMHQHDVAAVFGFNQGRISEVKTGKRHQGALEEAVKRLSR